MEAILAEALPVLDQVGLGAGTGRDRHVQLHVPDDQRRRVDRLYERAKRYVAGA